MFLQSISVVHSALPAWRQTRAMGSVDTRAWPDCSMAVRGIVGCANTFLPLSSGTYDFLMPAFSAPTGVLLAFGHFELPFWIKIPRWRLRPWNFACRLILISCFFWCYCRLDHTAFKCSKFEKHIYFWKRFIEVLLSFVNFHVYLKY